MIKKLFEFLDTIIVCDIQYKNIFIVFAATLIVLSSVIFIGFLIEKFNQIETYILLKFMSKQKMLFCINRLTFVGTIVHELSHAAFAWASGAKVQKIKMIKFFDAHTLGYVNFLPQGSKFRQHLQLSFTSCAPVITGIILLSILLSQFETIATETWSKILIIYLIISILNHMAMSNTDIKNYCKGLITIFPIAYLVLYAMKLILIN